MNKILKISIYLLCSLIVFSILSINNNIVHSAGMIIPDSSTDGPGPQGPYPKEFKKIDFLHYLLDEEYGLFNRTPVNIGDYQVKYFTVYGKNGQEYSMTLDHYEMFGIFYYGKYTDVTAASNLTQRTKPPGRAEFFGLTTDGKGAVPNFRFPDDYDTNGMVKNRTIFSEPWGPKKPGPDAQDNLSYRPPLEKAPFNIPSQLVDWYADAKVYITDSEADGKITAWVNSIEDKYKSHHDYWDSWSSNWSARNGDYSDHIKAMSTEAKKKKFYISMPPTKHSYGVATEWHTNSAAASGTSYDSFFIGPTDTNFNNIKATKLKLNKLDLYTYVIEFSAKNVGTKDIDHHFVTYYDVKLEDGTYLVQHMEAYHGASWPKGVEQTDVLGTFTVPPGLPASTKIIVYAYISPEIKDDAIYNSYYPGIPKDGTSNRPLSEDTYDDNFLYASAFTEGDAMCYYGGTGESMGYAVQVSFPRGTRRTLL